MRTPSSLVAPALVLGLCGACVFVHARGDSHADHHGPPAGPRAQARIEGRSGSGLSGRATFTERQGGVLVEVELHHAPPGWHAVHLHEHGDCSAEDASSAGGHFNPAGVAHGSPHAPEHHAGDLGNLWVDERGEGLHVLLMPDLRVQEGPNSVRGRALIVHAGTDDLVTQPTGNAGGRIGCGVIQ
jgi:Cu-Zn family superoxide dismutase